MRRTLPVILTTALMLAACGSDGDGDGGSADSSVPDTVTSSDSTVPPPTNPDKPSVDIPDEIPTELQVTVLEEGSGPVSKEGDTVWVDYVGVRSEDGVEFDNSYDRFQPFNVTVGTGMVIEGWDQGLIGVQAGSTIQLDIPSDLAYGASANGDIIRENEALTFLIEVRAVVPPADPEDEPTTRATSGTLFDGGADADTTVGVRIGSAEATFDVTTGQTPDQIVEGLNAALTTADLNLVAEIDGTGLRIRAEEYGSAGNFEFNADVPGGGTWDPVVASEIQPSEGATELTTVDLREGDGAELQPGQTGIVRYVLFRGDNLVVLDSNWAADPILFPLEEGGFPVLLEGLEGMKVGGRRAITFPPEYPDFGFGPEGRPTEGLPAATDVIIVADLVGLYGTPT